jgi:heme exporter protein A
MKLEAKGVACERNGRLLFNNLDFTLGAGDMAELRGPNGAGKSSLLRAIAGLVPLSAGHITLSGEGDTPLPERLHYIAHSDAMKPAMSVEQNLQFWCDVLGGSSIAKALKAFDLEGLRRDPVQLLSAGQRRRLCLSRLFVVERSLWLLDEPTTALDATSQNILIVRIQQHLAAGGLVIAATHGEVGVTASTRIDLARPTR